MKKMKAEKMENIINLVKDNSEKIKLIISGNCKYIYKKIKPLFFEYMETINEILITYNATIESKQKIKTLPSFYFRKNIDDSQLEQVLLKEEIEYCKKFNNYGMYYSIINCGKKIESKELLYYFCMLPIEYLNFEKDCNNIIFNFHNPIFLKAIKNTIRNLIKEQSFNFLLKEVDEKALLNAIFEEKLLTLLISYNKFKLKNWELYEKN